MSVKVILTREKLHINCISILHKLGVKEKCSKLYTITLW